MVKSEGSEEMKKAGFEPNPMVHSAVLECGQAVRACAEGEAGRREH